MAKPPKIDLAVFLLFCGADAALLALRHGCNRAQAVATRVGQLVVHEGKAGFVETGIHVADGSHRPACCWREGEHDSQNQPQRQY